MPESMEFELELKKIPVTIDGDKYELRELIGKERDKYLGGLSRRLKTLPNGEQTVKNFDGLQAALIAESLTKVEGNERHAVTVEEIQGWPARVQNALHDTARQLSALGDDGEETDNNDDDEEDIDGGTPGNG